MEYDDIEEGEGQRRDESDRPIPLGTRLALTSGLERHRAWTQQSQAQHRKQLKGLTPSQQNTLRAEQRQALDDLRSRGSLLDKRGLLDRRTGYARNYRTGAGTAPGRVWNGRRMPPELVPAAMGNSYPESLSLSLPATLVEQVGAACWSSSRESIGRLRQWRADYTAAAPPSRETPPAAEYRRLAAGVTTTGQVYRAGNRRGLQAALQTPTPLLVKALAPH